MDLQRSNALLQGRVEQLERKTYLLNLMQDRIEDLSLKVDSLSQKIKKERKLMVEKPCPEKSKVVSQPSSQPTAAPATTIEVSSSPPQAEEVNSGESPVPLNPRLDLKGVDADSPENIYSAAMRYLKKKDYDRAAGLFLYLVQRFPKSDLADNALYWTGECYYATHNYGNAIKYFDMVLNNYPDGNKVPDSMLKIAFSYGKMNKREKEVEYLKMVINNYPWSSPAKIAKTRLKEITGGSQ